MTVEGPPVSERNWACKHLAALARTFPSCGVGVDNHSFPTGLLAGSTGGLQPPGNNTKTVSLDDWRRRIGVDAVCQGTVIDAGWSDGERSEAEEDTRDTGPTNNTQNPFTLDYKIPCDHHGLSHLLKARPDGSWPHASCPDPPSVTPEPLTLQQELDRDPEAHMLAVSALGCLIRRCLFREGKGGVHLSNYGQARLEGNIFRGLNYAVRCIQNSTVNKIILSCYIAQDCSVSMFFHILFAV